MHVQHEEKDEEEQGEFSLKVFKRTGGREGKGICREMRAELGKGGYCKVPVEFKFLRYCCGITHDTCDTYNTSRYYKVPAIPTILQVFSIHTIFEKLLVKTNIQNVSRLELQKSFLDSDAIT